MLGYRNEYGLLPDGPPADLGRNGSFLVLRQLSQDVHGFWSFCERASARGDGSADAAARLRLAAKLVGRWPSGAPLALAPDGDDPALADANDFGYFEHDRDGLRCPVGAHVRRAHPRDSLDPQPGSQRSIDVGKRHRLLRRGRQYGRFLAQEELLTAGVEDAWRDEPRGLHFICLGTNLARQFEFVQHTWIENAHFGGLYDNPDPLLSSGRVHGARGAGARALHGRAAVRVGARGRVLLPAGDQRGAGDRGGLNVNCGSKGGSVRGGVPEGCGHFPTMDDREASRVGKLPLRGRFPTIDYGGASNVGKPPPRGPAAAVRTLL